MILPDKVYNIIKWVLMICVPASIGLIESLSVLYNFDATLIIGTISAIATFIGALVGISNYNYNKTK